MMSDEIQVGDRVKIFLDSKIAKSEGWFEGKVFKVEPYSAHRNFYWVELDAESQTILGIQKISVFNPKKIQKIRP